MSKSSVPPEHDKEARARIRNKLLHYMRAHRIGAPELTARIYAAQEIKQKTSVGISTVQRFLADKVRTVESYVDMFERFVEKFPSPDPIGVLGKAMAEYYGSEGPDRYAGEYNSTISYETARSRVLLLADLTITPDDGFCRVVEQSDMIRLIICDGVLVCNGQTAIMSLRDRTTKAPKQYLISGGDEKYSGWGTMAEFEPSVAGRRSQPSLHFVSARIEKQSVSYFTKPVARISTLEAMYRAIFQPASKDLILRGLSEPIIRQSLLARLLDRRIPPRTIWND